MPIIKGYAENLAHGGVEGRLHVVEVLGDEVEVLENVGVGVVEKAVG
jgi:hypothetical protein